MSRTMSLKESTSLAPSGLPLFSKFKSRTKDVESPKSVISDPRIVSPASSASASLERRLTDLKKVPRHDRVHSISDAEDENGLPGANFQSAALLSRQVSAKAGNGTLLLESVSEVHSLPSVPPRMGQMSGPSSETSSPKTRISRNAGKDGARGHARSTDSEFVNRRMSFAGADATATSVLAPLPHPTDLEGVYTQSFTCSPPKTSSHGESDRKWRNAAGCRDPRPNSSQTLARESLQGTRLTREDSLQSEPGKDAAVGSMYTILMNGFNAPTMEEIVSGKGTLRSGESIARESSTVKNESELPYEDQIELNKFVVRGSGGDSEEIRTGEHKLAWSHGTGRGHRNSLSGDGTRSITSGHRHSKTSKTSSSPGESPGHPSGFNELPRSALIELSSDLITRATSQGVKDFPEMQIVQKDTRTYTLKSTSQADSFDKNTSTRSVDGWKGQIGGAVPPSMFPADGPPSLHALPSFQSHAGMAGAGGPDSHNGERSFHYVGKIPGAGESTKANLRFVPGQFLKSNPLKPRPPPAKWDDAEKWLVNPASVRTNAHAAYGNGHISGGSTPQHISHFHGATSVRHHHLPSSNQSSRMFGTSGESLPGNAESHDSRFLPENGDASANTYPPPNVSQFQRSFDSSATSNRHEESLPVDVKATSMSNHDETGIRPEDKFADSITIQSTSPNEGRLPIVMKDAATEITPSTSQRDIATQITPAQSFHAAATPPRIHTGGPARLNTTPVHSDRRSASVGVDVTELQNCHQAKLELDQAATLDTNWATREEEVEESSKSLRLSVSRSVDFKDVKRSVLEARAAAWEEAEQSKYMARYHREEAKILAWEAHQKAKAEADMRRMEVKLERKRSHASELLQNKLASVHLKAENMRAAAAAECGEQAAKTNHFAQEIRAHGRSPTPPLLCCFPRFNPSYSK